MRDILFRGKIKGSGEWVEGNLATVKWWLDGSPITVIIPTDAYLDPRSGQGTIRYIEVIPESVGQYIGLKDADGRKIFEGDILESPVIHFNSKLTRRIIVTDIRECKFMSLYVNEYRIVGNVHDNPELLEVEYDD